MSFTDEDRSRNDPVYGGEEGQCSFSEVKAGDVVIEREAVDMKGFAKPNVSQFAIKRVRIILLEL